MKIKSIKIIQGANIYSHNSCLILDFHSDELNEKNSLSCSEFNRQLLSVLPNLQNHLCKKEKLGGFLESLSEGTNFNHIIEHIAIELLEQAGLKEKAKCIDQKKEPSKAVVETTLVETMRFVLPLAAEMAENIVQEEEIFIEEKVSEIKELSADHELGPSTQAIVRSAEFHGIPWSRENHRSLIQLGYGKNLRFIQAALTDETSLIFTEMASDKQATKERLAKFSLPVPDGEVVETLAEAIEAFENISGKVVVKPLDGRQGKGVTIDPQNSDEVEKAFLLAKEFSDLILIEEMFEGKNYRVLVVGGKVVAASERQPCQIIGDGKHNIDELIEIENQNPLRGEGHEKPLTKIRLTPNLLSAIEKDGRRLEDIPKLGEKIILGGGLNISTGGTAKDVTDEIDVSIKSICERAARTMDLDICGFDLILEDISNPIKSQTGGIIEVNTAPGLRMHLFPNEGKRREVGEDIIKMLYPSGQNARIPIIAITGTNGKTTVTRMISHIFTKNGWQTGTTTTDGVYLNDERIIEGDTTGPVSAKTVLGDNSVEIAILETARGGIVRRGLGFDWADIGVITNISEDHIGQDGIETIDDLINIKALVAERVRPFGTLIINADCENSLKILEREKVKAKEKEIILFSMNEFNPFIQYHLSKNGTAYFVKNGCLIEADGKSHNPFIKLDLIPTTMNGTAEFQIYNVMAAIAACRAKSLSKREIMYLQTFQNKTHNPGRSNLYRVGQGYALIDYGHNPGAFAAICKMTEQWKDKFVTGIIGVPGDRADWVISESGKIIAKGFDKVIIKEDKDLRGREKGEVAHLLCETILSTEPDKSCKIVLDEVETFENCLENISENEVVVLFYDKLEPIQRVLENYNATPLHRFESEKSLTLPKQIKNLGLYRTFIGYQ